MSKSAVIVERRRCYLRMPKFVPSHQQSYRHDNIVNLPMCALRQAFQSPRKEQPTSIGNMRWDLRLHQPWISSRSSTQLIFVDVTVISPIQEMYLNASTLKDVNIPMSPAHKHKVTKDPETSASSHWSLPPSHLSSTLSADFTRDSSSCSTQSLTQLINHPPARRTTHAGVTPTTGSFPSQSPTSLELLCCQDN